MFIFYLFFLLRFSEFNDEWSSTKLKYITKVVVGYVGTISKYYTNNNGVPLLSTKNITDNGIDLSEINYVTKEFHAKNKKSQIFSNDLLIARHGNSGSAFLIPETVSEAQALNVVIIKNSKNFDSYFMENYFETTKIKKYMASLKAGSVQGVVNTKDIEKISINLPSFNEQNKINSFLQLFDRKIQLLENQYQIYIDFKKYLMQQIFTQKLRFDFTYEWDKYLLGDISTIGKGFTPSTSNPDYWEGNLKWLSIADMNQGKYINQTTKKITFEGSKNKEPIKKGTLLMSFKLSIGKLGILNEDMYTNEAICNFQWKNKKIMTEYMYYYLSSINILKYGSQAAKGITLNNETLSTIPVLLPSIEEQNKIIDILSNLDLKINMLENIIKITSKFKKGLLQQMFV